MNKAHIFQVDFPGASYSPCTMDSGKAANSWGNDVPIFTKLYERGFPLNAKVIPDSKAPRLLTF